MIRRTFEALAVAAVLAFPWAIYFYNMTPP
jgi:hypothetical protein